MADLFGTEQWDKASDIMFRAALKLEESGADAVMMCCEAVFTGKDRVIKRRDLREYSGSENGEECDEAFLLNAGFNFRIRYEEAKDRPAAPSKAWYLL